MLYKSCLSSSNCIHLHCINDNLPLVILQLQVPRMTRVGDGEVPIRDLSLRCGQKLLDVSLWRDEALVELSLGDHVEISFLRATLRPAAKLNTSSYSAVEVHNRMPNYSLIDLSASSYTPECVPSGFTFF